MTLPREMEWIIYEKERVEKNRKEWKEERNKLKGYLFIYILYKDISRSA